MKTGELIIPEEEIVRMMTKRLSGVKVVTNFYMCKDCKTMFPTFCRSTGKEIYFVKPNVNGWKIDLCPWCRPDSKPWKNGRGI